MAGIEDRFHRAIAAKIDEAIMERMTQLTAGAAFQTMTDNMTTAEKYAMVVGEIRAYEAVRGACADIERDFYGPKEPQPQEQ